MPIPFLVQLAIGLGLSLLAYALIPKPKNTLEVSEMEFPDNSVGKPIPVVFGTVIVKDPNIIWYGEKTTRTYEV